MNSLQTRIKKLKNRKGFTLVELIVVIVIIGILAAILIPRLTGFTDKAKATQAVVWAKEVATAMDSFYAENSAWPDETVPAEVTEIETLSGVVDGSDGATVSLNDPVDGAFEVTYTEGTNTFTAGRTTSQGAVEEL